MAREGVARVKPGAEIPNSRVHMALPGFALVTSPSPKRSRWRYMPVAVASLVAFFLLYGVMEDNQLTRLSVAERAQTNNVEIDPDHLPATLVQYPVTVTGQTSGGQKVSCTIRALHDKQSPSCVIQSSTSPVPDAVVPSPQSRNDATVTQKPAVSQNPPVAVPPTNTVTPGDDDRPDGRPTGDDGYDGDGDDGDDERTVGMVGTSVTTGTTRTVGTLVTTGTTRTVGTVGTFVTTGTTRTVGTLVTTGTTMVIGACLVRWP